ncbi:uncharacterized protein LOC123920615 [Trifolium pratense]|uniref:uncharacterized protein LOC123920615 n=1 Tax=Trifolium pratense TaxID=57577 RepID=UPI001E6958CE|nr:uncharacterized protein LOC123920615 [Trifolium pratense]
MDLEKQTRNVDEEEKTHIYKRIKTLTLMWTNMILRAFMLLILIETSRKMMMFIRSWDEVLVSDDDVGVDYVHLFYALIGFISWLVFSISLSSVQFVGLPLHCLLDMADVAIGHSFVLALAVDFGIV